MSVVDWDKVNTTYIFSDDGFFLAGFLHDSCNIGTDLVLINVNTGMPDLNIQPSSLCVVAIECIYKMEYVLNRLPEENQNILLVLRTTGETRETETQDKKWFLPKQTDIKTLLHTIKEAQNNHCPGAEHKRPLLSRMDWFALKLLWEGVHIKHVASRARLSTKFLYQRKHRVLKLYGIDRSGAASLLFLRKILALEYNRNLKRSFYHGLSPWLVD